MSSAKQSKSRRATRSQSDRNLTIVRKRVQSLRPSPENLNLYQAIDPYDPDNVKLQESIRKNGVREPLAVTLDNYVVSGHRRLAAAVHLEQVVVPCIVLDCRRTEMTVGD